MQTAIRFDPLRLPPETRALREEVRAFIAEEVAAGTFNPAQGLNAESFSKDFSKKVGARGWIGMTWPKNTAAKSGRSSTGMSSRRNFAPSRPRPGRISWPTARAAR